MQQSAAIQGISRLKMRMRSGGGSILAGVVIAILCAWGLSAGFVDSGGHRALPSNGPRYGILAAAAEICDRTCRDVRGAGSREVLHNVEVSEREEEGSVIVCFPDGTQVTASSLASRREENPDRDFGLYMDALWAPTWDAELIEWPDFGTPAAPETAAMQIVSAFKRAKRGERVEVGCIGGIGRTGTVLACMAILAGVPPEDAVEWIRDTYHPSAVETEEQAAWVLWFGDHGC